MRTPTMHHPARPSRDSLASREVVPLDAPPPLVEELVPAPLPLEAWDRLAALPYCLFLDSALELSEVGRYSFLAADPFAVTACLAGDTGALFRLAADARQYAAARVPGLPPFQGGVAGLWSYDLNRQLERLPVPALDEFEVPALAVGWYDVVLAWDHEAGRAWLFSHGLPEAEPAARRRRAAERLAEMRAWLAAPPGSAARARRSDSRGVAIVAQSGRPPLDRAGLAPQYPLAAHERLTSNFSRDEYLAMIRRAVEYIHAGDVFQVNLAQRLLHPATDDSRALYRRLRERNAAPFAAYFDAGDYQILSASPERFLRVGDGQVETRPIKGTRRRSSSPEADLFTGDELQASVKDRAENVMIVDLLRNDLARVCRPASVCVRELCRVETYRFVKHLVSVVEAQLDEHRDAWDLLAAAFPGGSITGAPKVRAMQLIAELEPTARGAYCGALGYVGFDGTADMNILIRTITAGRGWWQAHVGGGIVADSDPRDEYQETWHKAEGLLRAML